MKGLETGKDKVKKICDVLRRETLEPAKQEGEQMISQARRKAEEMILSARQSIEKMQIEAQQEIDRQKKIFASAITQSCKQALEALKQEIEQKLFNRELSQMITQHTQETRVLAELITAVVKALDKEGIGADVSAYIAATVSPRSVNILLAEEIIKRLRDKSVLVGPLTGGIEVKLHRENITVDVSADALKELVAQYVRKDFRKMLFGE